MIDIYLIIVDFKSETSTDLILNRLWIPHTEWEECNNDGKYVKTFAAMGVFQRLSLRVLMSRWKKHVSEYIDAVFYCSKDPYPYIRKDFDTDKIFEDEELEEVDENR